MTFKTILVALDGSKHAASTADAAADLALRCDAKLLILHVVAPIFDGKMRNDLANLARMEHREQTEYEMLQGFGQDIVHSAELSARQKGVTQVEALVEVGDPAAVIVDHGPSARGGPHRAGSPGTWHPGGAAAGKCLAQGDSGGRPALPHRSLTSPPALQPDHVVPIEKLPRPKRAGGAQDGEVLSDC